MNELPGDPSLPPGVLAGDIEPPESTEGDGRHPCEVCGRFALLDRDGYCARCRRADDAEE